MTKVEQYEAIRRDQRLEGLSVRELSRKHKVHRRSVREALASAAPPERKAPERVEVAFGPWREMVKGWLEADSSAPRKQRHTARRVWQRLVNEYGASISESTVRRCVAEIQAELSRNVAKVPIVQNHAWGQEAEVDFGEVLAVIDGTHTKLNMFVMRLSASAKAFHYLYRMCDTAAFLDGHVRAFEYFGGVPARIRYDNLKPAVITVLLGRERIENQRFVLCRSHYGFDSFFCIPGIEGAHEKGGVEGEVGRFRRRWLTPVPVAASVGDLNAMVADADIADDDRHVERRTTAIGEDFVVEAPFLRPAPSEFFEVGTPMTARVDAKARVMVHQCRYSVPARLVGRRVEVLVRPDVLVIRHSAAVVATHERVTARGTESLCLDHYLETLSSKPGAFAGSSALAQARKSGVFTETHQRFWDEARRSVGDKAATKALIGVLLLHRNVSTDAVVAGMVATLSAGSVDPAIVAIEARRQFDKSLAAVIPIANAPCVERAQPCLDAYDELLEVTR